MTRELRLIHAVKSVMYTSWIWKGFDMVLKKIRKKMKNVKHSSWFTWQ